MTDFIVNDCRINNFRYDSFLFLINSGRFFLLLDGFDEMARHVDKEVRYQTISELSLLAKYNSKVILTGRPGYFPSHDELMQIIAGSKENDLYQIAREAYDELVDYEPFEIQPFNISQISEYINLYIQNKNEAKRILAYIKNTYNLIDLATRPVLLEMVVKSLPKLLTLSKEIVINSAKLYDVYTNLWIDREEKKGEFRKLIRKIDKLRFMEELAYQLFDESKNFVSYKQLNPRICKYFGVNDCDLDYFAHDIRTCSFIFRIPRKGYMFIHRSFQEFFVAKKIERDLTKRDSSCWAQKLLSKEILRYLTELLVDIDKQYADILKKWSLQDPSSILGQNALLTLLLTGTTPPDEIIKYYGLPTSILQSYAFVKLDGHSKSEEFVTYLYRDLLKCSRQAQYLNLKKNVDALDVVHDAFQKTLSAVKRQPLMQASKIASYFKFTIKSTQQDIQRSILRQQRSEISFSDLVEDLSFQGIEIDEDSLFGIAHNLDGFIEYKEMLRRIKEYLTKDEYKLFQSYYIDGGSTIELAELYHLNQNAISSRLHRIRKKLVKTLKESGYRL